MRLLFLLPIIFYFSVNAQTKTLKFPPSKDTIVFTYTITSTSNEKVSYIPVSTANKPPIASAGNDVSVTLPTNTVTLSAISSTDNDGTIVSYQWSKLSGGSAILNQANTALNVSGLTQGVYIFRVTVIDNGGLSDQDDVQVTVIPAITNPGYTLTFSKNYDNVSELNENQIGCVIDPCNLSYYLSTTIYKSGGGSFRSFVPAGGNNVSAGQRSEQEYNNTYFPEANPVEGAVEYDIMFDYDPLPGRGSSVQWHPNNDGSSLLGLNTNQGKFQVFRSIDLVSGNVRNAQNYYQTGTLKSIQRGKWYRLRWEFKWSAGSDGYARLYIDEGSGFGTAYYTWSGRTQDSNGKPYFKIGQNRWVDLSGNSIVYYDNLRVYKKQ